MKTPKKKRPYRHQREHRVWVLGERKDPPDTRKLSRAILALALEQAQAEADARGQSDEENGNGPG
jgi:hypothetical protein